MESSYIRYATERKGSEDVFRTLQSAILLVGTLLAVLMMLGSEALQPLMSLTRPDGRYPATSC